MNTSRIVAAAALMAAGVPGTARTLNAASETIPAEVFVVTSAELDAALATALDGQTIVLAKGEYPSTAERQVTSAVTLRGATGRPEDVILLTTAANYRHLLVNNSRARVESLTVDGGGFSSGANGFVCIGANGGTATNCIFRNGKKAGSGHGSVGLLGADSLLTHCIVTNNASTRDDQGRCNSSGVDIRGGARASNCLIAHNTMSGSDGRSDRCNAAGAVLFENGNNRLENCTVVDNAGDTVGGVSVEGGKVVNCVIGKNVATSSGTANANIRSGTDSKFAFCRITDDIVFGYFADYAAGDYAVVVGSPLIDAGDAASLKSVPAVDLAGRSRAVGEQVDVGCYEYQNDVPAVAFSVSSCQGVLPYAVAFTAAVANVTVDGYVWDFGDGTASERTAEPFTTHEYRTAGAFYPSVTAGGLTWTAPSPLEAFPAEIPVATAAALDAALATARDGQTIVLAKGEYPSTAERQVTSAVTLRGATGRPEDVILLTMAANYRHLLVNNSRARIESLTVDGGGFSSGANGFVCIGANGGTATNCIFRNGKKAGSGHGSVALLGPDSLLTHCIVTNNASTQDAQSRCNSSGVDIRGGARASNCLIAHNTMSGSDGRSDRYNAAGAVLFENGNNRLENCTVVDNAGDTVGGVSVEGGKVVNCVIGKNVATSSGTANANIRSGTDSKFAFCRITDDIVFGYFADYAAGDYAVVVGSPLIDAGDAASLKSVPAVDLAGRSRAVGERVDVGCYEYQNDVPAVAFSVSSRQGVVPYAVAFTAAVANVTADAYVWNFGDGTAPERTTEPFTTHVYRTAGAFYPSVTAGALTWTAPSPLVAVSSEIPVATAAELDAALATARDGQTIVLAKGEYPSTAERQVTSAVTLRGATGRPEDVILLTTEANYRHLLVNNPRARVESLTVDGGGFSSDANGFVCIGANGGTATNCIFRNGKKAGSGHGSVALLGPDSLLTHCIVTNNASTQDAQSRCNSSGVDIRGGARASNCLIAHNTMSGSTVGNDRCNAAGVALYDNANNRLENCTVVDNTGDTVGGVSVEGGKVVNCVIGKNVATSSGAANANIRSGTDSKFAFCRITDDIVFGYFADYAAGDYAVVVGSPLIDAGDTESLKSVPAVDLAGKPRQMGNGEPSPIDIGAYEFDPFVFGVALKATPSEGFAPLSVVLAADVSGTNGVDDLIFTWKVDGKEYVVETDNTLSLSGIGSGALDVELSVENGRTHEKTGKRKQGLVKVVPKVMKVVDGNPNAAFPFDTEANAAASVKEALAQTIGGGIIELVPGVTHRLCGTISVKKGVTIRGGGATPGETLFEAVSPSVSGVSFEDAEIVLDESGASLENMTIKLTEVIWIKGLTIGFNGGVVSNCVLTGSANEAFIRNRSDCGVVTHCVVTNATATTIGGGGIRPKGLICDYDGKGRYSNLLIVGNTFNPSEPFPFAFVRGAMENCTFVRNNYKLDARTDWDTPYNPNVDANGKGGSVRHVLLFGQGARAENCIFAYNLTNGVECLMLNMTADAGGFGGSVADRPVFNGTAAAPELAAIAPVEAIFRRPEKNDWQLHRNSPARDVVRRKELPAGLPSVDLKGNPRVFGVGLDAGCYECQSGFGLMLLVK